jgi:hypothetical protein
VIASPTPAPQTSATAEPRKKARRAGVAAAVPAASQRVAFRDGARAVSLATAAALTAGADGASFQRWATPAPQGILLFLYLPSARTVSPGQPRTAR